MLVVDATAVEGTRRNAASDRGQAIAITYLEQRVSVAPLSQTAQPTVAMTMPGISTGGLRC